ncbi:MAG: hypothetical protein QXM64_00620, partial [Candidatus Aenigmatarchaeota archaeon]
MLYNLSKVSHINNNTKKFLLFAIFFFLAISTIGYSQCSSHLTCSECASDPTCSWCPGFVGICYSRSECSSKCSFGCINLPSQCQETSVQCIDSDNGKNYNTKGYVKKGSEYCYDECVDSKTLKECYCEGNDIKTIFYGCPGGCKDGACAQVTTIPQSQCTDTDTGLRPDVKGIVTYKGVNYEDRCLSEKTLLEYFCGANNEIGWTTYDC